MPPAKLPLSVVLTIVALAPPSVALLLIPLPSLPLISLLKTVRLAPPFAKPYKTTLEIPLAALLLTTLPLIVMQAQRPSGLDWFAELWPELTLGLSGWG